MDQPDYSTQRTWAVVGIEDDVAAAADGDGGVVAFVADDRPLPEREGHPSLQVVRYQIRHHRNWAYAVETVKKEGENVTISTRLFLIKKPRRSSGPSY